MIRYILSVLCLSFVLTGTSFAADNQIVQAPNLDVQGQVMPTDAQASDAVFGGKQRGHGPEKVDPGLPKFDLDVDVPSFWGLRLVWHIIGIVFSLLINLAILALFVWIVIRIVKRLRGDTPKKFSLFTAFDDLKARLEKRREEINAEKAEVDARLPKKE